MITEDHECATVGPDRARVKQYGLVHRISSSGLVDKPNFGSDRRLAQGKDLSIVGSARHATGGRGPWHRKRSAWSAANWLASTLARGYQMILEYLKRIAPGRQVHHHRARRRDCSNQPIHELGVGRNDAEQEVRGGLERVRTLFGSTLAVAVLATFGVVSPAASQLSDRVGNALYENPGLGNHWLTVKLEGVRSNRSAIGARIHVVLVDEDGAERSIYRHVNSGGSFGGNPLRQTIGLGASSRIERLEVFWPTTGVTQTFARPGSRSGHSHRRGRGLVLDPRPEDVQARLTGGAVKLTRRRRDASPSGTVRKAVHPGTSRWLSELSADIISKYTAKAEAKGRADGRLKAATRRVPGIDWWYEVVPFVDALSPVQLRVLRLHFETGMSYGEVATHLGLPIGTVRSRAARTRESLNDAKQRHLPLGCR